MNIKILGEVFVAGLLHDIGKLVLWWFLADEFRQANETAKKKKQEFYKAELDFFGFCPTDPGGWLAEQKSLSYLKSNAIYYHRYFWLSFREPNLAMVVNPANVLANRAGYNADLDGGAPAEIHQKVISYLKLKKDEHGKVLWQYYLDARVEEMHRASGFLSTLKSA